MLSVGCLLMFLKPVCFWKVRLRLHPVACWVETSDLANVFPLGFE